MVWGPGIGELALPGRLFLATRHTKRGRISAVGGAIRSVTLPKTSAT